MLAVPDCRYGDRIVAIKVLNRGRTSEERAVLESRFIREVNMMSRVQHENLVKASLLLSLVLLFGGVISFRLSFSSGARIS